jgi:hypothetical protein
MIASHYGRWATVLRLATAALLVATLLVRSASASSVQAAAPEIQVTPASGLVTTEAHNGAVFEVRLSTRPSDHVYVGLSSSNTNEGTPDRTTLIFNRHNWHVPQLVFVTGVDDSIADGDVPYQIVFAPAISFDPAYDGLAAGPVSLINKDNDLAGITVTPTTGLITSEAGDTANFNVVLTSQPLSDVVVNFNSTDTTEGTVDPGLVTFTPANWNATRPITVTGVDDALDDGDILYSIVTTVSSTDATYAGINPADVGVTNTDDDGANVIISAISGNTTEAGGIVTFTVVLSSQPSADVLIGLSSSDLTEGTVSPASLTFTSATWPVSQTVTVKGVDDAVDDGDIKYKILTTASSADALYGAIDPADVEVTNKDDDGAGVAVSPISGRTTEAGGTATFSVKLTSQPTANVTIPLSSSDLSEGTVSPASLTFTPATWNTPQTVTVKGVDDQVDDGDVGYLAVLGPASSTDPSYALLDSGDVPVINRDNDRAGIHVSPTHGLTTTEAGGTATFTVKLDSQPTANVVIGLISNDVTEGTVQPASLTFTAANWQAPQTVTVTGVDDALDDGNVGYAIVTAVTSADSLYAAINPSDVTLTNTDNDTVGVIVVLAGDLFTSETGGTANFTIVLGSQPSANVTVGLSSSDTTEGAVSPASLNFTAADWNKPHLVTITGVDDKVDDGDIIYSIVTAPAVSKDALYNGYDAANAPVTNLDDDTANVIISPASGHTTEAGGIVTFTVVLSSQPSADVLIGLSSSDLTEGTVSPASLTFTSANWHASQAVTVKGVDDAVDDGDIKYKVVTTASSADALYGAIDPADVEVTNKDDDGAGVAVSPISGNTTEAGGTATFSVKLTSQPTANVTIPLSSSDLSEGTVSPASLTFTPAAWNTPQTVTVKGVDDQVDDGDVEYSIILAPAASTDPNYNGQNVADVAVVTVDDDTAGIIVAPTSGLVTTEAGGTASFTVKLNSQPTADVTIDMSSNDISEGTLLGPATLTFTAANWSVAQTVVVKGANDDVDDGDIAYAIITAPAASADRGYKLLNPPNVALTNLDNDVAGIAVAPTSGLLTGEDGTKANFTVVLTSKPLADVNIALSSSDITEGAVGAPVLNFTPANWNTPQTVIVSGVNDDVDDNNIVYSIITAPATSADTGYNAINPADVVVTNMDNDTAGLIVTPRAGFITAESGAQVKFTVALASEPSDSVTITFSSSDVTEGTVSPASLTFTAANWNIPRTVTVTGVDDTISDGDQVYTIAMSISSSDSKYGTLAPPTMSVTNKDNEPSAPPLLRMYLPLIRK